MVVYLLGNQRIVFLLASIFNFMLMKWKFHAEGIRIA